MAHAVQNDLRNRALAGFGFGSRFVIDGLRHALERAFAVSAAGCAKGETRWHRAIISRMLGKFGLDCPANRLLFGGSQDDRSSRALIVSSRKSRKRRCFG